MKRVVLDTNIVVSALFWKGTPRVVYDAALEKHYLMLTTEALAAELKRVLAYPKFAEQIAKRELEVDSVVGDYLAIAVAVLPGEVPAEVIRDPKDRDVLACAIGGKADFIVSGDKDLLVLSQYENIPILSADQFLEQLSLE
jgi:uncharacterized protein